MQVSANDIHHYNRRLELALSRLKENKSVSNRSKEVILSYVDFRNAQGLSIPRQVRYIFTLGKLSRLLGSLDLQDATKSDLVNAVLQIEKDDTSSETKRTEKECVKQFYRWLRGGDEEEYPPEGDG